MKCAICGSKADWDSSYGYKEFIVCRDCFEKLSNREMKKCEQIMDFIFICGIIRQEKNKRRFKNENNKQ